MCSEWKIVEDEEAADVKQAVQVLRREFAEIHILVLRGFLKNVFCFVYDDCRARRHFSQEKQLKPSTSETSSLILIPEDSAHLPPPITHEAADKTLTEL